MGEAQWFISWEEFKTIPPSLKHLSLVEEIDNRRIGTEFIDKLGHAIGISQLIIATAQVFFHRFYLRESFKQYNLNEITLTMIFLAVKVEESPRKLRDILLKGVALRFKTDDGFIEGSPSYNRLYERVLLLEKSALAVLCFDLTLDHPFRHLARIFNSYPDKFDHEFTKEIWTILTNSFYTPLCLLFPARVLAVSLLIFQMSKRPELFPIQPINLPQFLGKDEWEFHFSKIPKEEVDKALIFLKRTDLPFKIGN